MIKKMFLVWTFLCFSYSLFPMDTDAGVLPDREDQALRLVFLYTPDHKNIRSFALTSKQYHKFMLETANNRKTKFNNVLPEHLLITNRFHKYGSAQCFAYKRCLGNVLWLGYNRLNNGKEDSMVEDFMDFETHISHSKRISCDKKGVLSFYGYGAFQEKSEKNGFLKCNTLFTIIKYVFNTTAVCFGRTKHMPCSIKYKDKNGVCQKRYLNVFLEYPNLLKAILNSTKACEKITDFYSIFGPCSQIDLEFALNDIIIPDNYAEKIPFTGVSEDHQIPSFEELPCLKSAIEKRYGEQKKNSALMQ